MAIQAMLDG